MTTEATQEDSNIIDLFDSFEPEETAVDETQQTEEVVTEEVQEEQPAEEGQQEEETPDVVAMQAAQIQQLTAAVNALTAHVQAQQVQPPATQKQQALKEDELVEFIKDESELTQLLANPQELNKLFNKILQMGEARGREQAVATMPNQVREVLKKEQEKAAVINGFFAANKELVPHRDLVGLIAQNLVRDNPTIDTQTLLKETAKQTRARLGLKAGVATTSKVGSPAKKAGLPSGKATTPAGRPKEEVKTQALQDLQDLGILP